MIAMGLIGILRLKILITYVARIVRACAGGEVSIAEKSFEMLTPAYSANAEETITSAIA